MGKPTARGITPLGTIEGLEAELDELWRKTRGAEGAEVRIRMRDVNDTVRKSWREGESRKAMLAFGGYM